MSKKDERKSNEGRVPLSTTIGSVVGFLAFLVAGALPGLLYGGYAGLIIAGALLGTPTEPTLVTRLITGGGMLFGLLASLSLFLVTGAVLGTAVGAILSPFKRRAGKRRLGDEPEAKSKAAA